MLEPEGTVEIKFRQRDLIKVIQRVDVKCKLLAKELRELEGKVGDEEDRAVHKKPLGGIFYQSVKFTPII